MKTHFNPTISGTGAQADQVPLGTAGARLLVLIRGANDVASATAVVLTGAGFSVLLVESAAPAVTRRGQSFADAAFDGAARLAGVFCLRIEDPARWAQAANNGLALTTQPLPSVLAKLGAAVLVDARMRKRVVPEDQRGLARVVIGLGPNFVAGANVDLAVETAWGEDLGRIVAQGPTRGLAGEPKAVGGYGRERYVYAPAAGLFRTSLRIGDAVEEGAIVARIDTGADDLAILAPRTGILRGLVRDSVAVGVGTKSVEVVPHGCRVFGIGERPARIAAGVLGAICAGVASGHAAYSAPASAVSTSRRWLHA